MEITKKESNVCANCGRSYDLVKEINSDMYEALELIYSKCRRLSTEEIIIVGKALAKAEGK